MKTYSEALRFLTYQDRLNYLRITITVGVGVDTFGHSRWVNQSFYRSKQWMDIRRFVILRDSGCDLALDGRHILSRVYVHHIEPLTIKDFHRGNSKKMFDPENLICVSMDTHNAIHFMTDVSPSFQANLALYSKDGRKEGDTKLW